MKGWLHGFLCGALSAISASASTEGRGVAFAANKSQDPTVSAARTFAADLVDGKLAVAITSPGQDIGNASDSGSFYFFPEIGDCEVVATIPPLMQTGENAAIGNFAKAGIMFRLSTHANAPMVMFLRETSQIVGSVFACRSRMVYRAAESAAAVDLKTTTGDFPADAAVRCRLVRQGDVFSAWYSTNAADASWTSFAQWTAPAGVFADGILGGVALTPQNGTGTITATFDDVAVRGLVQATIQDDDVHVAWHAEGVCPPGHFLRGFTVSRSEAGTNAKTVLNSGEPVFGHSLVDTQAVRGVSYRYRVEAEVVPSSEGPLVLEAAQVVPVYGAQATLEAGGSIRLRTRSAEWSSGVRLVPPDGEEGFDFSRAHSLAVDVENLSTIKQMRLTMHLSSEGDDDEPEDHASAVLSGTRTISTGIGLNPGEKGTMRIRLPHPDIYLAPANAKGPYVIDTSHIVDIAFKSQWPFEEEFEWLVDCRLHNLRLEGVPDYSRKIPDAAYCPFVDAYGQFIHEAWPEKVKDDNAFANDLATETAALRSAPASWDEYGGWKDGPQLTATGSFRAEKVDGKWYLVTPSGHLFFSLGIDVIRNAVDSPNGSLHPDWYATPVPGSHSMAFPHWNLQRKFGKSDYLADYDAFVLRRLDDWGINTIGNWSGIDIKRSGSKPYVLSLFELHAALPRLGGTKFYDCFDPAFIPGMTTAVQASFAANAAAQQSVADPMCIGYFIDNELDFSDPVGKALKLDYDASAAKRAFLDRAEAKYVTVQNLNAAWATSFASWADVKAMTSAPVGAGFSTDRAAFETEWFERYFQGCRDAIQAASPAKLYLGSRFVGFRQSERLWSAAAQYCDVVTVNAYANSVYNISASIFRSSPVEKPILIGEFHFGTFGRGMFSAGLCPVGDQMERARSFTRYVQGALCHPLIVGCHWFQYRDQPLVGRGDGEAYQVGFVDVCDRVYPKLVQAARDIGENLYTYRQRGVLSIPMDPEVPTP